MKLSNSNNINLIKVDDVGSGSPIFQATSLILKTLDKYGFCCGSSKLHGHLQFVMLKRLLPLPLTCRLLQDGDPTEV